MHDSTPPPDYWGLIAAIIISTISGFISISRRVLKGHPSSILWFVSEFATAILCGYLMYNAYPIIASYLPDWATLPVMVAVAAHSGGRIFQELENALISNYGLLFRKRPPK